MAGFKSMGGNRTTPNTLAEINVTPLVDVMLVLLIVFMVSAPLLQQGVTVNLPKANAGSLDQVPDQVVLEVTKDRRILLNKQTMAHGTLRERLDGIVRVKPGLQVFVQADEGVPYGLVAQVMAEVKQAHVTKVGLVTEPGDPKDRL